MSSKLREALEDAKHLLNNIDFDEDSDLDDMAALVIQKIGEALAEPLRNCDIGTAEEQYARFKKWCENEFYKRPMNPLTGEPCKSCPCYSVSVNGVDGCNYLRWAQMPYEKGDVK